MGKTRKHLDVVRPSVIVAPLSALDRVVSETQTAEILGVSKATLRRNRALARVRMSQARIGYRLSTIYDYLEQNTEKPGER
jgi:hypothetical protein